MITTLDVNRGGDRPVPRLPPPRGHSAGCSRRARPRWGRVALDRAVAGTAPLHARLRIRPRGLFVALPEDWKEQQVVIMLGSSGRLLEGILLEVNNTGVAVSVPDPEDSTDDTVFYPWQQIHWITLKTD